MRSAPYRARAASATASVEPVRAQRQVGQAVVAAIVARDSVGRHGVFASSPSTRPIQPPTAGSKSFGRRPPLPGEQRVRRCAARPASERRCSRQWLAVRINAVHQTSCLMAAQCPANRKAKTHRQRPLRAATVDAYVACNNGVWHSPQAGRMSAGSWHCT